MWVDGDVVSVCLAGWLVIIIIIEITIIISMHEI